LLTGKHYFANENTMKEMLESEGIKIIDNQIQDFENLVWKPEL
jgi:methylated-DNA-protein-cysteine methyltransferase-like protein